MTFSPPPTSYVLLQYLSITATVGRAVGNGYKFLMLKINHGKGTASDSSVGIALGYGLDDRGSRVPFPAVAGNFSLHHSVQNGSGAHPASYPMSARGFSLRVKRPGREADHSPLSSAEVKNEWSYTSTPPKRPHGVVLS
jgi:hypothetical protein